MIEYYDQPGVADFLILRSRYEVAVQRGWKPGDRFRTFYQDEGAWYEGTLVERKPQDPARFADSPWNCFRVTWDDPEQPSDSFSPWELEPLSSDRHKFIIKEAQEQIPRREVDRILSGLDSIMTMSMAEDFLVQVDFEVYPAYVRAVAYPICLQMIAERLRSGFYRRIEALLWDVRLLVSNAECFNEADSVIVKNARRVRATLEALILGRQSAVVAIKTLAESDADDDGAESSGEVDVTDEEGSSPSPSRTRGRRSALRRRRSQRMSSAASSSEDDRNGNDSPRRRATRGVREGRDRTMSSAMERSSRTPSRRTRSDASEAVAPVPTRSSQRFGARADYGEAPSSPLRGAPVRATAPASGGSSSDSSEANSDHSSEYGNSSKVTRRNGAPQSGHQGRRSSARPRKTRRFFSPTREDSFVSPSAPTTRGQRVLRSRKMDM